MSAQDAFDLKIKKKNKKKRVYIEFIVNRAYFNRLSLAVLFRTLVNVASFLIG